MVCPNIFAKISPIFPCREIHSWIFHGREFEGIKGKFGGGGGVGGCLRTKLRCGRRGVCKGRYLCAVFHVYTVLFLYMC